MKNTLLIIGNAIRINQLFSDYLLREVRWSLHSVDSVVYLSEQNKNLFIELQEIIDKSETCVIAVNKDHFPTVSKLIATLLEDTLVLKESMLIPTKTSVFESGSFLIEYESRQINVLQVQSGERMPGILIRHEHKEAVLNVFGVDEQSAAMLLKSLADSHSVHLEVVPFIEGWGQIVARCQKYGDLSSFIQAARQLLGPKLIASQNVIAFIIEKLYDRRKTVTFAESCTGGGLAELFTRESGASHIFEGSVVSYSNLIKRSWLNVSEENLDTYGAVSEAVVRDMLQGALNLSNADYALALSGIAGPTGGTTGKPLGTVFIGCRTREGKELIERMQFKGDRQYIQKQSAYHAVMQLVNLAESDLS